MSETSFRKLMFCPLSKEVILPSCFITMDVAYWRITVTMIEICRKITSYQFIAEFKCLTFKISFIFSNFNVLNMGSVCVLYVLQVIDLTIFF